MMPYGCHWPRRRSQGMRTSGTPHPALAITWGVAFGGMTLALVTKGPEGLILAADSRLTVFPVDERPDLAPSHFDNATKLFRLEGQPYIGIVTAGNATLGEDMPIAGYLPELEDSLATAFHGERATVEEVADAVGAFYNERWVAAGRPELLLKSVNFLVAGFNEGELYGRVYEVMVPDTPTTATDRMKYSEFGIVTIGQDGMAKRFMRGFDERIPEIVADRIPALSRWHAATIRDILDAELPMLIPVGSLPLQDSLDFSMFLIRMTSDIQRWTMVESQGVGGPTDAATITRHEGFRFIARKIITITTEIRDGRSLYHERLRRGESRGFRWRYCGAPVAVQRFVGGPLSL